MEDQASDAATSHKLDENSPVSQQGVRFGVVENEIKIAPVVVTEVDTVVDSTDVNEKLVAQYRQEVEEKQQSLNEQLELYRSLQHDYNELRTEVGV